MDVKKIVILISLLSSQFAFAQQVNKPEKCPSVLSIKSAGIGEDVRKTANSGWAVIKHKFHYDTQDLWDFAIFNINASDENDAKIKANESLNNLFDVNGPVYHQAKSIWVCDYYGLAGEHTIAYTPPR